MSDLKEIMGMETPKTLSEKQKLDEKLDEIFTSKKRVKTSIKKLKPEGISREVFALTGGQLSPPPIIPTDGVFKEKRKLQDLSTKEAVKWIWKPFRNSARKDGIVLRHWSKANETIEDYPFARFNKKLTFFDYTDEQYEKYFVSPEWTKQETDELWDLCKRFDLRFIVIADRFYGNKSVEDIKDRYYSISKKLLELNANIGEDISKHPLKKFVFNKESEVLRKQQYERFYNRTKEEVEEEKMLIQEFKRIEAGIKKHQKEKRKFIKLTQTALGREEDENLKKKKKKGEEEEIEGNELPLTPIKGARKEKNSGIFIRSHSILTPLSVSNKVGKKVDDLLIELGIGIRPMPTAEVCKAFNKLRQDIVILLDLQKHVAHKEYHLQMLKDQKQSRQVGASLNAQVPVSSLVPSSLSLNSIDSKLQMTPESSKHKKKVSSGTKSEKKSKKRKKET